MRDSEITTSLREVGRKKYEMMMQGATVTLGPHLIIHSTAVASADPTFSESSISLALSIKAKGMEGWCRDTRSSTAPESQGRRQGPAPI